MTTNANDGLWIAFGEEVGEQLDNLDLELAKGKVDCDIHQVFRDFHTVKSSCAMLDLGSMKALAHSSEDYLDLVRNGKTALTESAIDVLLSAVEKLKQQLVLALRHRENPAPATDIIHAIQQLVNTRDASDVSAKIVNSELAELAAACRPALLALSQATQMTPALKQQLVNFSNVAELFDRPLLATLCRDIMLSFKDDVHKEAFFHDRLLTHQMHLMESLRCLQEQEGIDCAVTMAEQHFRHRLEKNFTRKILELAELFSGLEKMEMPAWMNTQQQAAQFVLENLKHFSLLFGLPELSGLLGYILQVLRSVQRGYCQPDPQLALALRRSIDHPYLLLLQEGEIAFRDSLLQARFNVTQACYGTNIDITGNALAASPSTIFSSAILYEVDIDMSNESATVEKLTEWLSQNSSVINSTSLFDQQDKALIRFRVEMDLPETRLRAQLRHIDPEEIYFSVRTANLASAIESKTLATTDHPGLLPVQEISTPGVSSLRIASKSVDELVTCVGEVVMARNRVGNLVNREKFDILLRKCRQLLERERESALSINEIAELQHSLQALMTLRENLLAADTRLQAAIQQAQHQVLDLRKMPVSTVFNRLSNIARKAAHGVGKSIDLQMTGQDASIDKGMMDILHKTLATIVQHLIVDAVNAGCLQVNASVQGSNLRIHMEINSPVPATDVFASVKLLLDSIGGRVAISTGNSTVVLVDFPRTVAMQTILLVQSGNNILSAIPERHIIEIRRSSDINIQRLQGRSALSWRGEVIPVVSLEEWTRGECQQPNMKKNGTLVIVETGAHRAAVYVDRIIGLRDAFVPEKHSAFSAITRVHGTTVLGDGRVVFILNLEHLMEKLYGKIHGLFHYQGKYNSENSGSSIWTTQ